ncbi:MAG: MFS transporter [Gammaproteobacteria bacterium]|nr:MFS transporter [Gammaproteobacteria bacterium]
MRQGNRNSDSRGQPSARPRWGPFEPLRERTFRRIWSTSLLSNFGQLILGVAAAWEMTRLTTSAEMVALVQTALMLPLMLVPVPGGAIADMFDRRRIAMTVLSWSGFTSPWLLLVFCSLIGTGVALYGPSWQASICEQVRPEHPPAAIAPGSISYNIARSFGPALGGMIVLVAGAANVLLISLLNVAVQLSVPRWVMARALSLFNASLTGGIALGAWLWVQAAEARQFHEVMQKLRRVRLRNGGFDWSIARDIADPALWTERYHLPTWGDYLRLRSRFTQADRELQARADAFHASDAGVRVRRRLERPFGSVRWRAETPDPDRDRISLNTS